MIRCSNAHPSLGPWYARLGLLLALFPMLPVAAQSPLTLAEAERLALSLDPGLRRLEAEAVALEERSQAATALPDPKFKFGAMALPVDTFDLDQEPMTQLQVGVVQHFPPAGVRQGQAEVMERRAQAVLQRRADRHLRVQQAVREAYLDLRYQAEAGGILDEARGVFAELVTFTRDRYAVGKADQQDVYRAELELGRLDERRLRIAQAEDDAREQLSTWIGGDARRPLAETATPGWSLPANADELLGHPAVQAQVLEIQAGERGVDVARARYRPAWSLDVSYGDRSGQGPTGAARPDFLSAMVMVDLPLFTEGRQDRELAASLASAEAARQARDDLLRQMTGQYSRQRAALDRLGQREALIRDQLLVDAAENAEAALAAYRSGVSGFDDLMRARILEFELRLDLARVRIDADLARARLAYFHGEGE